MIKSLKAFVGNEFGATAIEYALIASLIAVALVGVLGAPRHPPQQRVLRSQQRPQVSFAKLIRANALNDIADGATASSAFPFLSKRSGDAPARHGAVSLHVRG